MARTHARILTSIWSDPDWRTLSEGAQRVYLLMLSQPNLSMVGVLDFMPSRWAKMAANTTAEGVRSAVHELEAARFVVVDEDTEEVLIRTLVRHDGAKMRANSNLLKGVWSAWAAIQSPRLQRASVDNLPEDVWTSKRVQAHPDALRMRGTDAETPTSERSEPSVSTNGSNGEIEPPVATQCLLPTEISTAASTVRNTGTRSKSERRRLLEQACGLLADRHVERVPSKFNTRRHHDSVATGKFNDYAEIGMRLAGERPGITPAELADLLEPPPTKPPAHREYIPDRERPPDEFEVDP